MLLVNDRRPEQAAQYSKTRMELAWLLLALTSALRGH